MENRIKATTKLFFGIRKQIINKRELSARTTKVRIRKVSYIYTLSYGSELWTKRTTSK